jgi:hypothetical protein
VASCDQVDCAGAASSNGESALRGGWLGFAALYRVNSRPSSRNLEPNSSLRYRPGLPPQLLPCLNVVSAATRDSLSGSSRRCSPRLQRSRLALMSTVATPAPQYSAAVLTQLRGATCLRPLEICRSYFALLQSMPLAIRKQFSHQPICCACFQTLLLLASLGGTFLHAVFSPFASYPWELLRILVAVAFRLVPLLAVLRLTQSQKLQSHAAAFPDLSSQQLDAARDRILGGLAVFSG